MHILRGILNVNDVGHFHKLQSSITLYVFSIYSTCVSIHIWPRRQELSTILSLDSRIKWQIRPQLRKFSNHHHQQSGVYTQLSKNFFGSHLYWIYTQSLFFKDTSGFMKWIKYTKWNVYIKVDVCYIIKTCCRIIFYLFLCMVKETNMQFRPPPPALHKILNPSLDVKAKHYFSVYLSNTIVK